MTMACSMEISVTHPAGVGRQCGCAPGRRLAPAPFRMARGGGDGEGEREALNPRNLLTCDNQDNRVTCAFHLAISITLNLR